MYRPPLAAPDFVLDLIRHGEPEGGSKYRGTIDDPLSELGWQQLDRVTQQALADGAQWGEIVSSPLRRCREFAEPLATKLDVPFLCLPSLQEMSFGILEGQPPASLWQMEPEMMQQLWHDPTAHTPPGGETYTKFKARVTAGLEHLLRHTEQQQLLLVVHGGTIRMILHLLLGSSLHHMLRLQIPHAGLSRIKLYNVTQPLFSNDQWIAELEYLNRLSG